eukprot:CAMPEP_0198471842 /NCGR_PEP_ID=MMETSP1456-20131121/26435_1 /TAXON_ID=1461544 ORGANISM="Unidentified sp., Strain RCC1871" /NCGR_SAMPLE_ID=MMETSP1456 /ASSEMBLY_ACC=CAM_ASM_001119 /LENGTH=151 /DNA_ID=CAMNT_0044198437 /DNA_START=86 /DNA_END=538 /DNA_ORIENTATION=+
MSSILCFITGWPFFVRLNSIFVLAFFFWVNFKSFCFALRRRSASREASTSSAPFDLPRFAPCGLPPLAAPGTTPRRRGGLPAALPPSSPASEAFMTPICFSALAFMLCRVLRLSLLFFWRRFRSSADAAPVPSPRTIALRPVPLVGAASLC